MARSLKMSLIHMKVKLSLLFIMITLTAFAQDYQTAFGFRGSETWGPGYKFFVNEQYAVDIIASFRKRGMQFTALMETHKPVFLNYTDHLYSYAGFGAHVGYVKWIRESYPDLSNPSDTLYFYHSSPVLGADGVVGLEYRFFRLPIAVSVDWKPYIEFFGRPFINVRLFDIGGTVKFTF